MSNPVDAQWFTSDMPGAPALSGTVGTLIAVLDACLLNGFGSVTLTSLTVSGGVATAVKAGHGFLDYVVVLIEGSTPSELNGKKRIAWVDANTFTFDATGITDQTATGTITAKVAPVGWDKPHSGTNKAGYARTDLAANAMMLRVDDTPPQYSTIIMYETMSDVDTGTGPAPTSGSYYFCKSNAANTTARQWRLFADGRGLYLFCKNNGSGWYSALEFNDSESYKNGDGFGTVLHAVESATYQFQYYTLNSWGLISRSYSQSGGPVSARCYTHSRSSTLGSNFQSYPAPADSGFHAWPMEIWEGSTLARGLLAGIWNPIHASPSTGGPSDGLIVTDIPQLPGRRLMLQEIYNGGAAAASDLTGPWRE